MHGLGGGPADMQGGVYFRQHSRFKCKTKNNIFWFDFKIFCKIRLSNLTFLFEVFRIWNFSIRKYQKCVQPRIVQPKKSVLGLIFNNALSFPITIQLSKIIPKNCKKFCDDFTILEVGRRFLGWKIWFSEGPFIYLMRVLQKNYYNKLIYMKKIIN